MDNSNINRTTRQRNSKILAGLFIITFGVLFLLERQGMPIADWAVSWKTILIAIGVVTLYKHNFRHFAGYVLIGIGTIFLINEAKPETVDTKLILPVIVILFGGTMIAKSIGIFDSKKKRHNMTVFDDNKEISSEDYIQATTFFGGVTKNVVSKDFKGADFTTAFGGTEINLTRADIQQPVTINASTYFGGITQIVPSNWKVNSEITTAFGAVEDKRNISSDIENDPSKTLTLKGSCYFGGVEIHSYI